MTHLFPAVHKMKRTRIGSFPALLPPDAAICSALSYTGVKEDEATGCTYNYANGFYEILFSTDWLSYDVYVDCRLGAVTGCSFEPVEIDYAKRHEPPAVF